MDACSRGSRRFQCVVIKAVKVMAIIFIFNESIWSGKMKAAEINFDKGRLEFAKETIRLYGDKIPEKAQKGILAQQVLLGMSPYEAKLAGGAFYYKVEADPTVWKDNADPLLVMDRQSIQPDKSKIWMTFENETQFPEKGKKRFSVYVEMGAVQEIKLIE